MQTGNPITAFRREIRAGLIGLAVPVVIVGGWALLAPHNWYGEFPVGSGRWSARRFRSNARRMRTLQWSDARPSAKRCFWLTPPELLRAHHGGRQQPRRRP